MSDEAVSRAVESLDARKLWDRRPDETERAWHAFLAYRDMEPPRSIRKVSEALGYEAHTTCGQWSRDYAWTMRCAAYDAMLDAERQHEVARIARERAAHHANVIDSAIYALGAPALMVAERIANGELKLEDDVPPAVALALVERTAKLIPALVQASRLVHGESTENLAVQAQERRSRMTAADADAALLALESGASEGTQPGPEGTEEGDEGDEQGGAL